MKYFLSLFLLLIFISLKAQYKEVTVSGFIKDEKYLPLAYVNVVLKNSKDSSFISGVLSDENGLYTLAKINPGNYLLEVSYIGYVSSNRPIYIGSLSPNIELETIKMQEDIQQLSEVVVSTKQDEVNGKMDKKTYSIKDNISQSGGSVLQALQNLPSVTIQDGKVQLRGNDKIMVLIDGKQTAMTGFGNQSGLDNIPASNIDKIEIINNPSSKYDANGNGGIINIIYKKNNDNGFNGKVGLALGAGALWLRKNNLPNIRPQYTRTPKLNPSINLNYKINKVNLFYQGDYLYTETLNKNEFVTRTYDDGTIIQQQTKRNRNTHFQNNRLGIDWELNNKNAITFSTFYGIEKIIDNGDEPFYNNTLTERKRLWMFLEDELKTTIMATTAFQHRYKQPGHLLNFGYNYTFHREDEKYYFTNILPTYTGYDAFKLISDESVHDFNLDYIKPMKYGRIESGLKVRDRNIPTNMQFFQGLNSPLDKGAGGKATYHEIIPALYSNYVFETPKYEAELGLRVEYVKLNYYVNPDHNTYKSDGYNYTQPFPSARFAYKINEQNKLSLFYNRRVDRPNEVDIRIFPKYDDAEIIKIGNPALKPQFTNAIELAYKSSLTNSTIYAALYHRMVSGTITRIASTVPGSNLIYNIFQNANRSYNTGLEFSYNYIFSKAYSTNISTNFYYNNIAAFTVENKYPIANTFTSDKQTKYAGNIKMNNTIHLSNNINVQIVASYFSPDIIPQGSIGSRYSLDVGLKRTVEKGKGEFILNATDLFNTMVVRKNIVGSNFTYTSNDYNETQVVRIGYNRKF